MAEDPRAWCVLTRELDRDGSAAPLELPYSMDVSRCQVASRAGKADGFPRLPTYHRGYMYLPR